MTSNYDIDIRENMDLINALNKYQKDKDLINALNNYQQGIKKMEPETYTGKKALIALINGMKLRRPYWTKDHYFQMRLDALIFDECGLPYRFDETSEFVEYKEPKTKKTYYRAFYRLKNSNLKLIYSTSWHPEESDIFQANYEIVETETREF